MMVAQLGNQLVQLFSLFQLRPAAGSSSIRISGWVTMQRTISRQTLIPIARLLARRLACWSRPIRSRRVAGAVERLTLHCGRQGFQQAENNPVFSC